MASTTSPSLSLPSSSTIVDAKTTRQSASQCVTLPTLPHPPVAQCRAARTTAYCRKIARNVVAMATSTGEVATTIEASSAELTSTELPEIVKTLQEAWDKVDDKYAVSTLGVAAAVALYSSTGVISAIDRLPLVPGVLELVGIGYTGWFAYKNLVFKPDREVLISKIKGLYKDIIGSS